MLPVFVLFTFESALSQWVAVLLAVAIVAYITWSNWRNAGSVDPNTKKWIPGSTSDKLQRAALWGVLSTAGAIYGLRYALPVVPFLGKGQGEGIPLHTYGLFVGGGFFAAAAACSWLSAREWPGPEGQKRGDQIWDMAFYLFAGGLIGARLLFSLVNWKETLADPISIISPFKGGLVFYGAFIGGVGAFYWYCKKYHIPFLRFADVAIPNVSIAQAFGRLGCYSAGCCWGDVTPAGSKWGVHFPGAGVTDIFGHPARVASSAFQSQSAATTTWVIESTGKVIHDLNGATPPEGAVRMSDWVMQHGHTFAIYPTQLFESFGQMCLFALLLVMQRYKRFHGQILGMWLMSYAVLRSSVELFRGDAERGTLHGLVESMGLNSLASKIQLGSWYNISISQFISICLFLLGATLVAQKGREWRKHVDPQPTLAAQTA